MLSVVGLNTFFNAVHYARERGRILGGDCICKTVPRGETERPGVCKHIGSSEGVALEVASDIKSGYVAAIGKQDQTKLEEAAPCAHENDCR